MNEQQEKKEETEQQPSRRPTGDLGRRVAVWDLNASQRTNEKRDPYERPAPRYGDRRLEMVDRAVRVLGKIRDEDFSLELREALIQLNKSFTCFRAGCLDVGRQELQVGAYLLKRIKVTQVLCESKVELGRVYDNLRLAVEKLIQFYVAYTKASIADTGEDCSEALIEAEKHLVEASRSALASYIMAEK